MLLGCPSRAESPVAQTVKNPPATQEAQIQSLSREDPLEKGMAAHSSILAWRIPWTEEPGFVFDFVFRGGNCLKNHPWG